ncbi:uncharacterized protein LOC110689045 [Chenopodium quinoa]|uniref:uncharacterized protein LOC110689045 n=1 Tax=Chenopodium quinoa TaxID=63459 RepID=UPI000B7886D1|nr:uncharacterized protein LOC110689045 [Chenopodium quinoa]
MSLDDTPEYSWEELLAWFEGKSEELEDGLKVNTATMYLVDDAKLWWRTKYADIQAKRTSVDTWEDLKKELMAQFYPENTEFVARTKLATLQHKTSIHEYVKEYSACMLEIHDMSEKDRLFNFVRGPKDWAQREIWRQKTDTLSGAIAATERLMDYSSERVPYQKKGNMGSTSSTPKSTSGNSQTSSNSVENIYRSGGEDSRKGGVATSTNRGWFASSSSSWNKPLTCILCRGPHKWFECQHKAEIDNLQKKLSSMSSEPTKGDDKEEDVVSEEEPSKLGAVYYMCAMEKETSGNKSRATSLMYVDVVINGKKARAMVDTGATHNFVTKQEANRLGLKAVHSDGQMKTVNSEAQPTFGVERNVNTKIGEWSGTLDFTVATMDDFELVLGMNFLHSSKAVSMPHLGSLLVTSRQPCLLWIHNQAEEGKELKGPLLSGMQLKKGIRRNEPTFLATLSMKEEEEEGDIPEVISELLGEFSDILPKELPKSLPPRRAIDHSIELVPGARPPERSPYRMAPPELAELQKQLDGLLEAGFIRPSRAPYGALVLFQKKQVGSLRFFIDYRALNKLTVRNHYPIPLVADLFDQLGDAVYFTKLDLRSGYHQVRIAQGDEQKTACGAEETTSLFFKHIVKYWGLPQSIISDRDTRFTSIFWTELFRLIRSDLNMSSSHHRQSDGQTKRFNGLLEEYLRHFVSANQKDWVKLLDVAQLCFNAQKSTTSNRSPFELVMGQQPLLPHTIATSEEGRSREAREFKREWQQNMEVARAYLERASKRMKKWGD